jgi:hypothetical protein
LNVIILKHFSLVSRYDLQSFDIEERKDNLTKLKTSHLHGQPEHTNMKFPAKKA